jgi:hypothetical protein
MNQDREVRNVAVSSGAEVRFLAGTKMFLFFNMSTLVLRTIAVSIEFLF